MRTPPDQLSREDLGALIDACPGPLLLADRDGKVVCLNRAARIAFGDDASPGSSLEECAEPEDVAALRRAFAKAGDEPAPLTMQLRSRDDHAERFEVHVRPVSLSSPRPAWLLSCSRQSGATHDALTELPNRSAFLRRLDRSLGRARQRPDYRFALLILDLDQFSLINHTLGDVGGDQVLRTTATRLLTCVRPGDMVARIGPDQFAVIADHMRPDADPAVDATRVAERIQASALGTAREEVRELRIDATRVAERIQKRALGTPIDLGIQEIFPSASIGITVSAPAYDSPEQMFRDADVAMHRAKAGGGGRYELFDLQMNVRARERLQLETDLRRGVERDEFRVFYQPIIELDALRITGLECLLRWQHPQNGLRLPEHFLDVAEEMGVLFQLNVWLLREACRQAKAWRERLPEHARLSISVNFSSLHLQADELVRAVSLVLEESGPAQRLLTLEMTEGAMVRKVDQAMETLRALKDLGIDVHLDDFGTGYSSLSYLHQLPVDAIKIDPSFTQRAVADADAELTMRTIVDLIHRLKRSVIAEGIETREQLERARGFGCDFAQGYFFSKPLDAAGIEAVLRQPPWLETTSG